MPIASQMKEKNWSTRSIRIIRRSGLTGSEFAGFYCIKKIMFHVNFFESALHKEVHLMHISHAYINALYAKTIFNFKIIARNIQFVYHRCSWGTEWSVGWLVGCGLRAIDCTRILSLKVASMGVFLRDPNP